MKLWFKKPLALLVAALAFVACSPDTSDTPLSPPLGAAISETGSPDGIRIRVCKAAVLPGDLNQPDVNALGEYDFTYSVDGAPAGSFSRDAVSDRTLCRDASNVHLIDLAPGAETVTITELPETLTDPDGYALLHKVALTGDDSCEPIVSLSTDPIADGEAGNVTLNFSQNPDMCTASVITLFFKNTFVPDEDERGMEGCTPGAWRNQDGTGKNGKNRWPPTGYAPETLFESVFGDIGPEYDALTLRAALDFNDNSGGLALIKHATAAFLNASHPDVAYPYSAGEVVQMFQDAWADLEGDNNATKDMFDEANNLGCPI